MSFNSPVWFNVGVEAKPQCSACFINSVQDSMSSIMDLAKTEAMLFKFGSGAGSNLSTLRSSKEKMSAAAPPPGPSASCAATSLRRRGQSGGKTRRAAKMVILDVDHPDIDEFINCKLKEEKKAWALIEAATTRASPARRTARSPSRTPTIRSASRTTSCARWSPTARGPRMPSWAAPRWTPTAPASSSARWPTRLGLRRPRHPVRHHDQRLEPGLELGSPVRDQPLLRVLLH